jgi:hypothetical protein
MLTQYFQISVRLRANSVVVGLMRPDHLGAAIRDNDGWQDRIGIVAKHLHPHRGAAWMLNAQCARCDTLWV